MSDSIHAYYDDVEDYLGLCKVFCEEPEKFTNGKVNPYGAHRADLELRLQRNKERSVDYGSR